MNGAIMALVVLATCRLNRLIVTDVITLPLRAWANRRKSPPGRFLAAIMSCMWCTGVYTATATSAYAHWLMGWNWQFLPLTALAVAWLAPTVARWFEE